MFTAASFITDKKWKQSKRASTDAWTKKKNVACPGCCFSHWVVSDSLVIPWTVAHQAPLSMGFFQARILEWVATPFSRGSSHPRDQTCVSCIGRQVLYHWATREAHSIHTMEELNGKSIHEKNEVLIHTTTRINLENNIVSERCQTQEATYCIILIM